MITSTHWGAALRNSGSSLKDQRDGCVCVCERVCLEDGERKERIQGRGSGNREGGGAGRGGRIGWLEGWRGEVLRREWEGMGQTRRQGDGRRKMENGDAVKDM